VEKDDYLIRAHVRSERREILEKMLDLPLMLSLKMSAPITLDTYKSFARQVKKRASQYIFFGVGVGGFPMGATTPKRAQNKFKRRPKP
jgi:hypothetical protein